MYERTYKTKVLTKNVTEEKKPRRKKIPWRRLLIGGVVLVAVAGAVLLTRWPKLQVHVIEVQGTKVADPADVEQFIRSQIAGNFLYVFPKSSMLLVPTASLGKWTARAFPRFASVDVRRKGVNGLEITVVERDGVYLWCTTADHCFFMTSGGVVFAPAPFFSGDAYPKLFIGEEAPLPFSPMTEDQRSLVELLLQRLHTIGIDPAEFHQVSAHELDVVFSHNGSAARLLIDPSVDAEKMLEDLATGLGTAPLKEKFASKSAVLEYLDARFTNKLLYKFAL